MDILKKFLTDLIGSKGYESLCKGVSDKHLSSLAAPRVLLSWLATQVDEMKPGEQRNILMPGTNKKFISLHKGTGESYSASLVENGTVLKKYDQQLIGDAFELPQDILRENGIQPEVPSDKNYRTVMAAVGKLADILVKARASDKHQTDMEEDHKVHDCNKPEEIEEARSKKAEKDKSLERRVPTTEEFEKPRGNHDTLPFQKKGISETKQKSMEEDHKVNDDNKPEKIDENHSDKAEHDKSLEKPVPTVEQFEKPRGNHDTLPFQKDQMPESPDNRNENEEPEPDEEDIFFTPHGHLGALTSASAGGKHLGVFQSDDEARSAARLWANKMKFWPNAWQVSDHGNHFLIPNFHSDIDKGEKKAAKKAEVLEKPYVSDAQRRWAHTATGTKALGGESAVHEWDRSSKGKDLPEKVKKEEIKVKLSIKKPEVKKADIMDMKGKKIAALPWQHTPKQGVPVTQEGSKHIAPKSYVKEKWNPNGPRSSEKTAKAAKDLGATPKFDISSKSPAQAAGKARVGMKQPVQSNPQRKAPSMQKAAPSMAVPKFTGTKPSPESKLKQAGKTALTLGAGLAAFPTGPIGTAFALAATHRALHKPHVAYFDAKARHQKIVNRVKSINSARAIPDPTLKGEMPGGAGIPKQPAPPKPPVGPSKQPQAAANKQAQASARGKQMVPAKPKMQAMPKPTMKSEKQFPVSHDEAFSKCEHCQKTQFKKSDGSFDPCLCFQVETHSKESFAKLVKSEAGYKIEFRKGADPESMRAFMLTLKLGLLARKINKE